jgi:hypothetical protein
MKQATTFDVFRALSIDELMDVIAGKTVTVVLKDGTEITVSSTTNNTKKTKKTGAK